MMLVAADYMPGVPGARLSPLCVLSPRILTAALGGGYHHRHHFRGEKTEA